jgi:hypothetical protein
MIWRRGLAAPATPRQKPDEAAPQTGAGPPNSNAPACGLCPPPSRARRLPLATRAKLRKLYKSRTASAGGLHSWHGSSAKLYNLCNSAGPSEEIG